MSFDPHSRSRLTHRDIERFPGETLFDRLARVVCDAGCLPRKELFEAWEVGKRVRRRFKGVPVVDLAAGHGLLAWVLLLLDDSIPEAICVDRRRTKSAGLLEQTLTARWPRLSGRLRYVEASIDEVELPAGALLVSVHACGPLTDLVLDLAIAGRHPVAVLPCCHSLDRCDTGQLDGWLPVPLAIDATRAGRLRAAGFAVHTMTIPDAITPENRLLFGVPG